MDKTITKMDLENLIMTKSPYNILTNLKIDPLGNITADVKNEYHYPEEGGPIGAAEFGRHIGVLGSIQLAKDYNFGSQYFFLVTNASLNRRVDRVYEEDEFQVTTSTLNLDKRKGKIFGQLKDTAGNVVFDGTLEYVVLKPEFFFRVYDNYFTDKIIQNTVSPYINRKALSHIKIDNHQASALYGKIQPCECEGHFDNYPALPIAILGNLLSQLGIRLFKHYSTQKFNKIIVSNATIQAYKLAFHGDDVTIQAEILETLPNDSMRIFTQAMANDEMLLDATIEFKGKFF